MYADNNSLRATQLLLLKYYTLYFIWRIEHNTEHNCLNILLLLVYHVRPSSIHEFALYGAVWWLQLSTSRPARRIATERASPPNSSSLSRRRQSSSASTPSLAPCVWTRAHRAFRFPDTSITKTLFIVYFLQKVAGETLYNMLKLNDIELDGSDTPVKKHKINSIEVASLE